MEVDYVVSTLDQKASESECPTEVGVAFGAEAMDRCSGVFERFLETVVTTEHVGDLVVEAVVVALGDHVYEEVLGPSVTEAFDHEQDAKSPLCVFALPSHPSDGS